VCSGENLRIQKSQGGTATSPSGDVINRFDRGDDEFSDVDPRSSRTRAAADKAKLET